MNGTTVFQGLFIPICIIVLSFSIGVFVNNFIDRKSRQKFENDTESVQYVFVHALRGVPVFWCLGVGLYWTINSLGMSPALAKILSYILFTVIVLTLTRVVARTLSGMIAIYTQKGNDSMPTTSLLTNIVNIIIYMIGVLIVLQDYGVSIAPIVTALGIGGMAVALGLQETLTNVFAGLHLILSRQLRPGDYICLSTGEEGFVKDITWRFATILSLSNNIIVVPNQKIASTILTNYSMPCQEISVFIAVGVSYDSDLDKVERVTLDVAHEVMKRINHKIGKKPAVRFNAFADSSINFNVILHSSEFENRFMLKHEFIKALTKKYREESINIPYPIRTVFNEK
ncbi:MAG: mechanosensitive ion channel domain-containing protein [Selenomonadaceae bacterium]